MIDYVKTYYICIVKENKVLTKILNIMTYFVDYNGKFIACYQRISSALSFIQRKGLKNDLDNVLRVVDKNGDLYCPITGKKIL